MASWLKSVLFTVLLWCFFLASWKGIYSLDSTEH